ncbi:ASCH domain-containing protein [Cupriavidus taiwanensis]|uniref:ASCH domain-containing protein n=1 Tax=Cupriavidus taiwanensis TaxID=164546 RepID=UPI00157440EB|nr:ASCH domain-containing protein [Cupriavidus taiwanensis]NSX15008.1 ASCH domain-containing protein [Cupriavidus taiwanensis]
MKALSIRQPWAWLIVNGHKDVENRTWPTRHRGRFLIHASQGMTRREYEEVEEYVDGINLEHLMQRTGKPRIVVPPPETLARGGIVGEARLFSCVPSIDRQSVWHMPGHYGFQLADAKPLPFVPIKGKLGFFEVPNWSQP